MAAAKSVKYVGLFTSVAAQMSPAGSFQLKWTGAGGISEKTAAETPTAAEIADANLPDIPANAAARTAARTSITNKAQAWNDRIIDACAAADNDFVTNGGEASNSVVGIKYIHPKFSSGGGDGATTEWQGADLAWLQIEPLKAGSAALGYARVHPDSAWVEAGGESLGNGVVVIPHGVDANREIVCVAHEVGHATKVAVPPVHRDLFGPGDHSAAAGLMDISGSIDHFTPRETKILQGILTP